MFSSPELGGQVHTGGAGGLGGRLRGGLQHQRPHLLHQRQERAAADSRGAPGQPQRVSGMTWLLCSSGLECGAEQLPTAYSTQLHVFQLHPPSFDVLMAVSSQPSGTLLPPSGG